MENSRPASFDNVHKLEELQPIALRLHRLEHLLFYSSHYYHPSKDGAVEEKLFVEPNPSSYHV